MTRRFMVGELSDLNKLLHFPCGYRPSAELTLQKQLRVKPFQTESNFFIYLQNGLHFHDCTTMLIIVDLDVYFLVSFVHKL